MCRRARRGTGCRSAWAARAGLLVQQTDKALADKVDKSLRAGAVSRLSNRDQIHLAAARDWSAGDYPVGTRRLASLARAIGLALARGFADFGAGHFAEAAEPILGVRGIAQRFGGSHAQRDILTLTARHAAIRGKMKPMAEALSHERLQHKPCSAWAGRLAVRVSDITREHDLARAGWS